MSKLVEERSMEKKDLFTTNEFAEIAKIYLSV